MNLENFKMYAPFCSYHCQEWARLEDAQRYINTLNLPTHTRLQAYK